MSPRPPPSSWSSAWCRRPTRSLLSRSSTGSWSARRRGALFLGGLALLLTLQGLSNHLINHEWWYSFRIYYGPLVHWPPRILTDPGGYPQGAVWTYAAALVGLFVPPFSLLFLTAAAR